MQSGKRDKLIMIQRATSEVIEGEDVLTWIDDRLLHARAIERGGRERYISGFFNSETEITFQVLRNGNTDITAGGFRARAGGRILDILAVANSDNSDTLELLCRAGAER
jgi:head-tail adaptor